jgi:hypothetical protein
MSNYKIITDEKLLKEFIDWLPDLEYHEKYYFCLFARSKYTTGLAHIRSDKAQLKRGVSDKERLFDKLKQLEIPLGYYKQREIEIPQECLAVYITPNPRNMYKASINTMVKLANCIRDSNINFNPHQEALSEIQKCKSRTCFIDFDIDEKDIDKLRDTKNKILNYVNFNAITWLKTRGGVHCLNPSKVADGYRKSFYQNIRNLENVDQCGDQMIPIPGTFQGGFTPHFIK